MSRASDAALKQAFLREAVLALGATKEVLGRFDQYPLQSDPLDFSAYVASLMSVCHRVGKEESGVQDVATLIQVFDAHHAAVREGGALGVAEIQRGYDSARRCREWLRDGFRSM